MPRAAAYVVVAWSLLASLAGGCRCKGEAVPAAAGGGPGAASSSASSASSSSPSSAPPPPPLAPPWAASRRAGEVIAVGPRREGAGLVVRLLGSAQAAFELPGSEALDRPVALDVTASRGGVVVRIEDRQGQGRWWRSTSGEGLRSAAAEEASGAACAVGDRLLGLVRTGPGLVVRRWAFDKGEGEVALELPGGGGASLQCGTRRAYLFADDNRALRALDEGKALGPFPLEGGKGDEYSLAHAVEADGLVVARVGPKGEVSLRRWAPDAASPGPWVSMTEPVEAGASVEEVLSHGSLVALVLNRHVDSEDCKGTENFHTIAELVVYDAEARKLARPKLRLDTWRCGAEAGPFGGGVGAQGFVVSWPRGADVACSRLGVRYGGLGKVEVPFQQGAARTGKIDAPSSDLVDLGCEEGSCGAVLLARGDTEGCWAAADERSYQPRWVTYP